VNVRARVSIPYFRANLETKCPGIRLQTCARTQNFDLVAGCLFFTEPIPSGIDLQPPPFFGFSYGMADWIFKNMAMKVTATLDEATASYPETVAAELILTFRERLTESLRSAP